MQYVAMKFDMVKSRQLPERADIQKRFLHLAREINLKFSRVLEAKFVVTHGDEAQALLKLNNAQAVFSIFEYLSMSLREVDFRCGIGFGALNTPLQETAIGMDGPAWQNAQKAIDLVKRRRQIIHFEGKDAKITEQLNALANLLCYLQSRWTKEQAEAICLLLEARNRKEIATKLGISNAAVSKRLTNAGWRYYAQGKRALQELLSGRGLWLACYKSR